MSRNLMARNILLLSIPSPLLHGGYRRLLSPLARVGTKSYS
jgi:hypothetical protein